MLSWFHKSMVKKRERFTARVLGLRTARRFERLEDRAMLSATMGPPQFGQDSFGYSEQGFVGPPLATAGMHAPPIRNHIEPSSSMSSSNSMGAPNYGPWRAEPGTVGRPHGGDSTWSLLGSQQATGYPQVNQPAQQSQTTYYILFIRTEFPQTADDYLPPPSSSIVQAPPKSLAATAPPVDPPQSNAIRANGPTTNEMPRSGSFASSNAISFNSAALSIPTATQIATRDVDSAALLPSTALDAAFQSYAARLLLTTGTSAKEYSLAKSLDGDAASRDDANGDFIRMADFTIFSDDLASTDAVERERTAVDEVLHGLEELDTLPTDSVTSATSTDESAASDDFGFDSLGESLGFAPITGAEGGMVMLRASDGANDAAFNLLSGDDANIDVLGVRVGVEASVGFYQAVDVAEGGVPLPIGMPTASPAPEPARNIDRDERVSTDREGSSPKAAAAIGATTFVGAMLWIAQRPRKTQAELADSDDQRRRSVS